MTPPRPTHPAAVSVEGLTVRRGDRTVVRDVDLEVAPGEVVGVLGKRHAGTSTVLRATLGLLPATGRIRILGRPYARLADPASAVGAFFGPVGNPDERVRDHVRIAAALLGAGPERVDAVLRDADLEDQARVRRRRLTTNARQRLGIAMVRLADPKVVVLDDPATGLDPEGLRWLRATLRELADAGCAVLVAAHPLSAVADDLDRAIGLADGTVVVDAPPEELRERVGREVVARTPDAEALAARLRELGAARAVVDGDEVRAADVSPAVVTTAAAEGSIALLEARVEDPDLEQAIEAAADAGATGDREAPDGADDLVAAESAVDGELDGLPASGDGVRRLVVFASPVRGAGSTTLVAAVADALAAATDLAVAGVALSVDRGRLVRPAPAARRSRLDVLDLARDAADDDGRFDVGPYLAVAPSGARLLEGPADDDALSGLGAPAVRALLGALRAAHDVVLVDLGSGLPAEAAEAVADLADDVVLVGTPDAGDALAAPAPVVEVLEARRSAPAILALNRAGAEQARAYVLERRADRVVVPDDPELVRAMDRVESALDGADDTTRLALKHLAAVVAGAAR